MRREEVHSTRDLEINSIEMKTEEEISLKISEDHKTTTSPDFLTIREVEMMNLSKESSSLIRLKTTIFSKKCKLMGRDAKSKI